MREEVDGVGEREGGGGLRGCRMGEGDGEDIEEGRGLGSAFRLSAFSSISGRCSLAFKRSCNTAEEAASYSLNTQNCVLLFRRHHKVHLRLAVRSSAAPGPALCAAGS